jgi:uncharacterized glyoxalase superfamily protein PhnB
MYAAFRIGHPPVMATNGQCGPANLARIFAVLDHAKRSGGRGRVCRLAECGQVQMPITKTFAPPCFSTLRDRFGVAWMVTVE